MNQHLHLDNATIAAEQLRSHHTATGEVMTLLQLQQWFADELKRRPSTTTLAKVRKGFLETLRTPDPKTEEMRAFERAFATAIAPYRERAENAERGEQEALKAADIAVASADQAVLVAQQRFELLLADAVKKADDAERMRKVASEATESTLVSLTDRLAFANQELSRSMALLATASAERDGALAEAVNLRRRLEDAVAANARDADAHVEEIKAERARSDAREARAGEQMSETTAHWAEQVATLRDELKVAKARLEASDKALLAARVDADVLITAARREAISELRSELHRLADGIGGANAVHNTHMGALRTELEALTQATKEVVRRLEERLLSTEPRLPKPS